jgi:hypothetical protein
MPGACVRRVFVEQAQPHHPRSRFGRMRGFLDRRRGPPSAADLLSLGFDPVSGGSGAPPTGVEPRFRRPRASSTRVEPPDARPEGARIPTRLPAGEAATLLERGSTPVGEARGVRPAEFDPPPSRPAGSAAGVEARRPTPGEARLGVEPPDARPEGSLAGDRPPRRRRADSRPIGSAIRGS